VNSELPCPKTRTPDLSELLRGRLEEGVGGGGGGGGISVQDLLSCFPLVPSLSYPVPSVLSRVVLCVLCPLLGLPIRLSLPVFLIHPPSSHHETLGGEGGGGGRREPLAEKEEEND
jgi:hypothetical protein